MSKEIVPIAKRRLIAAGIDEACSSCQEVEDPRSIDGSRESVKTFLESLNFMYLDEGFDTSVYLEACLQACHDCLKTGKTGEMENSHSGEIMAGIWEEGPLKINFRKRVSY